MPVRRASLRSLAKINLGLHVLHKRSDGYHELRTIFHTISLADRVDVEFSPGRGARIELESGIDVPHDDNLVTRAAQLLFDRLNIRGHARFGLNKRIPMGGGLGGGSSNAAAVLLALPVLAGRRPSLELLQEWAAQLGSDVPFFLYGGAALGLGRGNELYPLPESPELPILLITPGIHVSTPEAYRALSRSLTPELPSCIMSSFQTFAWRLGQWSPGGFGQTGNDFEDAVFRRRPVLGAIKRKLLRQGASPALMSGSGSAVFGVFEKPEARDRARAEFVKEQTFPGKLVSRKTYRRMWMRQLAEHRTDSNTWPPQSRYAK